MKIKTIKSLGDVEIHGDHIETLSGFGFPYRLLFDTLAEIVNYLVEENYIEFTSKLSNFQKED